MLLAFRKYIMRTENDMYSRENKINSEFKLQLITLREGGIPTGWVSSPITPTSATILDYNQQSFKDIFLDSLNKLSTPYYFCTLYSS